MAIAFVAAGSVSAANGATTTPGIPAGMSTGHYMLMVAVSRTTTNISIASGWTSLGEYDNTSNVGTISVWGRAWVSGDTAPSVTGGSNSTISRIFGFSGVNTTTPVDATRTGSTLGSVTTANLPSIVTATAAAMVLGVVLQNRAGSGDMTNGTPDFTEVGDNNTALGNDCTMVVGYYLPGVAGTVSGAAVLMDGGNNSTSYCISIAAAATGNNYTQSVTGSSTPSGAIKRIVKAKRTGSVTATGSLKKFIRDLKAGTITATGAVRKVTKRLLTGSTTASGTLGAIKKIIKALTGSITAAGSIRRKVSKRVLGATSPSGIATKLTRVRRAGVLTAFGGVLKKTSRKVLGSITAAASLVGQFIAGTTLFQITLTGAVTAAGALKRKTSTTRAGVTTAVGALRRKTSIFKAGVVQASSIAKKFSNAGVFSGSITPSGFLDTRFFVGISLAGSITATGGIVKRAVKKTVVGTVTAAGVLRRKTARRISGAITIFAFIAKKVTRKLVGSVTATGSVDPNILLKKSVSGQATPAGSVSGSHIPAAPVGAFSAVARALYGFFGRRQ